MEHDEKQAEPEAEKAEVIKTPPQKNKQTKVRLQSLVFPVRLTDRSFAAEQAPRLCAGEPGEGEARTAAQQQRS